jgi:phosphotransferase system  glucose/maltose/N-acetylglucosamine-specific IIC component
MCSQIVRTAAVENESAQIEGGNSWRWMRWLPLVMLALFLAAVIVFLLLFTMFGLRHRPRRKSSNENKKTSEPTNEDEETI